MLNVESHFFLTCNTFCKLYLSPPHAKSLSLYQRMCNSNSQQNGIYPAEFIQMLFNSNAECLI
jgi:hypothetical protein